MLQIYFCKLYETFLYICQYYLAAMSGWKLLNQLVENICLQTWRLVNVCGTLHMELTCKSIFYLIYVSLLTVSCIMLKNGPKYFKGTLSGLRQFLATESPLKMMKKFFYFTLKALFVLKKFKFLSWLFGHVEKRLD